MHDAVFFIEQKKVVYVLREEWRKKIVHKTGDTKLKTDQMRGKLNNLSTRYRE